MRALFDHAFIARRAGRVARLQAQRPDSGFLLERALDDLALRLAGIRRDFLVAADMFSPDGVAAALAKPGRTLFRIVDRPPAVLLPAPEKNSAAGGTSGLSESSSFGEVVAGDALPLAPESLDLAVSLLALHWRDDLPGLFAQIRGALRPDGLFLACLVGGRSLHELRSAFARAEAELEGGASPRVIPFVDVRDLGGLLQRAGFAMPVTDVDSVVVRYADPLALMADLRAMGAANPLRERSRRLLRRATLFRALELYRADHADPDGRIRATFDLVWLSGWAPHESQRKPLAPGSATHSLADALASVAAGRKGGSTL